MLQVSLFTITSPNTVNILWQLPQILVITVAEIMFSITGLEFSYSQVISQLQVKYPHVRGAKYFWMSISCSDKVILLDFIYNILFIIYSNISPSLDNLLPEGRYNRLFLSDSYRTTINTNDIDELLYPVLTVALVAWAGNTNEYR